MPLLLDLPLLPAPSYQSLLDIMIMEKKRQLPSLTQLAKIAVLLLLFLLTPFVPSSLRSPYLYLLFNVLVVSLGVEAGFLAAISGPRDDKKPPSSSTTASASRNLVKPSDSHAAVANARLVSSTTSPTNTQTLPNSPIKLLADAVSAKDVVVATSTASTAMKKKIKKCPSRASIFFIGSVDGEDVDVTVHEEEEEKEGRKGAGELMTKQELFTKAEAFIGNFYKQLKMQREESWNKLQDLYYHHHYKAKAL
ncbi:uncharacterized protein LOC133913371 [Phragmites australis]|uniref:uncharacterized protein LOC133913371 n=1 Tax=Phragmites australis TaxID=29695 RepID=UPI002D7A2ACC|nr:uncharacterized protein LOC133913371 [Phragmites australis]